jgi:hypothetical protein
MNREQRREWRRHVFGHASLTDGQKVVLLALETYADYPDGTNARPGVVTLAEMCGFGERVVKSALKRGQRLKLIEQTARANPKRGLAAVYRLLPVPVSRCTSVHVETDFKVHETTFQGARNDVSRCTTVPPTNPYQSNTEGGSRKSGTSPGEPLPSTNNPPPPIDGNGQNPDSRCRWCKDTGIVLDALGLVGIRPRICYHHSGDRPRFRYATRDEAFGEFADALTKLGCAPRPEMFDTDGSPRIRRSRPPRTRGRSW